VHHRHVEDDPNAGIPIEVVEHEEAE
jgi:hypothetical protein